MSSCGRVAFAVTWGAYTYAPTPRARGIRHSHPTSPATDGTPLPNRGDTMVVVTDESTRADLAEAMGHVNFTAKRTFQVVGTPEHPTLWDRRHELLNAMLDDWQTRG